MRIIKAVSGVVLFATCLTAYFVAKLYETNNIGFGQAFKIMIANITAFAISFLVFIRTNRGGCKSVEKSDLSNL